MNVLFASDGSILDSCIPDTAVIAVSGQSAATLVTPGVYVLQGISKINGWPETFGGKCMLSIAGTTQSICTSHTLFANSTIYYRADGNDEWKRADGGYSADDPVILKLQADVKSNTEMVQKIEEYVGTLLNSSGKLKESILPDTLVHNRGVVKTESDLPKNVAEGDYATVLETNTVWMYSSSGGWENTNTTSIVTTVNGQTGDVIIDIDSISNSVKNDVTPMLTKHTEEIAGLTEDFSELTTQVNNNTTSITSLANKLTNDVSSQVSTNTTNIAKIMSSGVSVAPNPSSTSDTNAVATTAWVRDRLIISSGNPSGGYNGDIWFKY